MKVGYARAATGIQNINMQEVELSKAGCEKIYSDIGSGIKDDRIELGNLLADIQAGDIVMAYDRSRISRNLTHFKRFESKVREQGATLQFIRIEV